MDFDGERRETRSANWLQSHGWVLNGQGFWVDRVYLSMQLAQAAAVGEARAWREAEGLPQRPKPRVF